MKVQTKSRTEILRERGIVFLPKLQCSDVRLKRYHEAHEANRKATQRGVNLSFSEWVREALDERADRDLED